MPRDRDGTFEPAIVKKRQRRLSGVDQIILSLSARGLTNGEVSAHFADVYAPRCRRTPSPPITDKVLEEMTDWRGRPLDRVYPVIFIDAIAREGPRRAGHQPTRLRRYRGVLQW